MPEAIATRAALSQVVAARARAVAVEYRYEEQPAEVGLNLAADRVLREIYGSDLRRSRVEIVESAEVFVEAEPAVFRWNRVCLLY